MARWRLFFSGNHSQPSPLFNGWRSPGELQRIIRRERDLADRFEGSFALLVFTVADPRRREATWTQLAPLLQARLRSSDEVGWLSPQRDQAGIVMHRTPAEAAWTVGAQIVAVLPPDAVPPLLSVRYYPSDPSLGNDAPQRRVEEEAPAAETVRPMEALFIQPLPLWKRSIDIVGAAAALLLLSPVFLLVAVAIKLTSPGPVFFFQQRRGWGGRRFTIYKFRSMTIDAEEKHRWLMGFNEQDGPAFKMKFDPRVTRIGGFLRKTNIDELPQFWNVLKGDMSLVGPRPLICPEADACALWQRRRLDMTPGITGIWQVHGSRDNFDEWIRMDLRYLRTRTLWGDVKLLLQTVPALIGRRRSGF